MAKEQSQTKTPENPSRIQLMTFEEEETPDVIEKTTQTDREGTHEHVLISISEMPYKDSKIACCDVCERVLTDFKEIHHCPICAEYDECSLCYSADRERAYLRDRIEFASQHAQTAVDFEFQQKEHAEYYAKLLAESTVREYHIGQVIQYHPSLKGVDSSIVVPPVKMKGGDVKPALVMASRPNHPITQPEATQRKIELHQLISTLEVLLDKSEVLERAFCKDVVLLQGEIMKVLSATEVDQKAFARLRKQLKAAEKREAALPAKYIRLAEQVTVITSRSQEELVLIARYFKYLPEKLADAIPSDDHPVNATDDVVPIVERIAPTSVISAAALEGDNKKSDETEDEGETANDESTNEPNSDAEIFLSDSDAEDEGDAGNEDAGTISVVHGVPDTKSEEGDALTALAALPADVRTHVEHGDLSKARSVFFQNALQRIQDIELGDDKDFEEVTAEIGFIDKDELWRRGETTLNEFKMNLELKKVNKRTGTAAAVVSISDRPLKRVKPQSEPATAPASAPSSTATDKH